MRFVVAVAGGLVAFGIAAPAAAVSLEAELGGLLEAHPQLAAAAASVRSAAEGEAVAGAAFLPTLTLSGDGGHETTDSPATRAAGKDLSTTRYANTAALSWNLFDGWASTTARAAARLDTRVAKETERRTVHAVVLEAATAYLDVLRQLDLLRLARSNEATIRTQLELEDERVKRGSGIAVDVLLAKSRLQVSKERRTVIESGLADASSRYEQVFGHPPERAALAAPVLPEALLPASKAEAMASLEAENPALLTSLRRAERAEQVRLGADAGYYPKLDLVAQRNWEKDVDGVAGIRRDYAVMGRVSWEIFSGFATRARVAQAAAQHSAALSSAHHIARKTREELELAWHLLESTGERRGLLANAVTIAAEVFAARQALRDAGKETSLNVLDAENELLNACINFVNVDFEGRVAVYRVLFAVGRLDPEAVLASGQAAGGAGRSLAEALPESAAACGFSEKDS